MDTMFGQLALRMGFITAVEYHRCREDSKRRPLRLGQVLVKRGHLTARACSVILKEMRNRVRIPEGTRIGRYVLRREIARGGMGVVYEADDPHLRRRVALKLALDREWDTDTLARVRREGAIQAQFRHPNIAAVHEVGVDAGRPYLVLEYVAGETLEKIFQDRKAPLEEMVGILESVAETVGFVHRRGIVHGDLKPANVIVEAGGRVVVTDFGLSYWKESGPIFPGEIVGTPLYMAPEQIVRGEAIDPRADVWALGVMLYEATAGRPPFDAGSTTQILRRIRERDPAPLARRAPDVPPGLDEICRKALEKDRERRFACGAALAAALRAWRKTRTPSGLLHRVSQWLARRSAVATCAS